MIGLLLKVKVKTPDSDEHIRDIRLGDECLLKKTERWVEIPEKNHRMKAERAATEKLRQRSGELGPARSEVSQKANRFFQEQHSTEGLEDARWTVQCLDGKELHDPFLYRLYARNMDIFGDKAATDLYVFQLPIESPQRIVSFRPRHMDPKTVTVHIRAYALFKALKNQGNRSDQSEWFSPIVSVAAILSPVFSNAADPFPEDFTRLMMNLENASIGRLIPDCAKNTSTKDSMPLDQRLKELFDYQILSDEESGDGDDRSVHRSGVGKVGILPHRGRAVRGEWNSLALGLTSYSGFVVALQQEDADPLCSESPASEWRSVLYHFLARLCASSFHLHSSDSKRFPPRWHDVFQSISLSTFCKRFLPQPSAHALTNNSVSLMSPGRKVQVLSLRDEECKDIYDRRRSEKTLLEPAVTGSTAKSDPIDYTVSDPLNAVAWNALCLGLIAMQEALLQVYHDELSLRSTPRVWYKRWLDWLEQLESFVGLDPKHRLVCGAIDDFDDFYDTALFDVPGSAYYDDVFKSAQRVNGITHAYKMLEKKLAIENTINARNAVTLTAGVIIIAVVLALAKEALGNISFAEAARVLFAMFTVSMGLLFWDVWRRR
ncbi:MAG: hypothetical protein ACYDA5_11915 [Vulcanimicrobiaceae bacterium]